MSCNDPHRFTVTHDPSGDEAEADDRDGAILAARMLLEDNEFVGQCRIFEGDPETGRVVDMVWATEPTSFKHYDMRWN